MFGTGRLSTLVPGRMTRSCTVCLQAQYMEVEARDNLGRSLGADTWERVHTEDMPEVRNDCDSGVVMLKSVDLHTRGLPLSFSQEDIPTIRRQMGWEMLRDKATFISEMRCWVQHNQNSPSGASDASGALASRAEEWDVDTALVESLGSSPSVLHEEDLVLSNLDGEQLAALFDEDDWRFL